MYLHLFVCLGLLYVCECVFTGVRSQGRASVTHLLKYHLVKHTKHTQAQVAASALVYCGN